jgi:hypothetical protein
VQPAVAGVGARSDHSRLLVVTGTEFSAGSIGLAVMPGRLDQQSSGMVLPVLVIEPWLRRPPLDCSLGTKPSQARPSPQ